MAGARTPTCPQCGAPLPIARGLAVVTCEYCKTSSWVQRGLRPTAPPPQHAHLARVRVEPSAGSKVAGFLGLSLGLLGAGAGVFASIVPRNRAASVLQAVAGSAVALPGLGTNALAVADPKHVDLTEIIRQARALATAENPRAQLTTVVAQRATGGLVDATGDNTADVTLSWRYHDATKPPGADLVEGSMIFAVYQGEFRVIRSSSAGTGVDKPIPDPGCTSQRAWATAVQSGVPSNAIASIHLYDNASFSPKSPWVWSVRVDGHDEHRREIDARDCKLVKSWAKKR